MTDLQGANLQKAFADEMGRLLGPEFPKHLILAVSGGGDSMAMLYLAAPWARVMGITLYVCTVDHGLRPEAKDEASLVARACKELGLYHQTLTWAWDGTGNVQEAAREARLDLINRWRGTVNHVLMAHTQDDQAETFLMRLARGSGVDGLSAMAPSRQVPLGPTRTPLAQVPDGPPWPATMDGRMFLLRPLLAARRADLRHFLNVLKIEYANDPSNEDPAYDRVKMRQAQPALDALGLSVPRLAATAGRLTRAREVLERRALEADALCRDGAVPLVSDVPFDRDAFAGIERETQLRLLAAALQFVGGEDRRPRLQALEGALDRALAGGASTLHGGYVYPHGGTLYVCPEYARVAETRPHNGLWRGYLRVGDIDVRALGEAGAAQLRDLTDLPARVLWPAPAVWDGDRVTGCPRIGFGTVWRPSVDATQYRRFLASH